MRTRVNYYNAYRLDGTIDEAIKLLQDQKASGATEIDVETDVSYGEPECTLHFYRQENEQEKAERERKESQAKKNMIERRRRTYLKLKEEFGDE